MSCSYSASIGFSNSSFVGRASKGGSPGHPGWFHNLVAEPEVTIQVMADELPARARVAEGEDRTRLWGLMAGIWPAYDEYAARTERVIPVVVLETAGR